MSTDLIVGEKEYDFFKKESLVDSLAACASAGYSPLFLPEFADLRIAHPLLFRDWGRSMSIRATGKGRQGNAIEIYAHVPGDWSEQAYIADAIAGKKLINYTLPLSDAAILDLEERDGEMDGRTRLITVMDHAEAQKAKFDYLTLEDAMENPHVVAAFGSEDRTQRYLAEHKKVWGDTIHVWHSNDLGKIAVARPLLLNFSSLTSYGTFNNDWRLLGVRRRDTQ